MDKSKKFEIKGELSGAVNARPVKSFFVSMLTRDIRLEDSILDLLDNCVDGAIRSEINTKSNETPFKGYFTNIAFSKDLFEITDNCGGIPKNLHDYAFRMGRPNDHMKDIPGTLGVYGIGMKRAIFKLGNHCLISSTTDNVTYEVEIDQNWLDEEEKWEIPIYRSETPKGQQAGTSIVIGNLYKGISDKLSFDKKSFEKDLDTLISTHYAFILHKGFTISINGVPVKPRPVSLIFSKEAKNGVRPYVYKTTKDGVKIFLAVGFTREILDETAQEDSIYGRGRSSLDAGWTIVCNDRIVLYADKTEMTGWGQADVPNYHTQFISISGLVTFESSDPLKLPTTTTKRGIDGSSSMYLQVKNKMMYGMKLFTNVTHKWKGKEQEFKNLIKNEPTYSIYDFMEISKERLKFRNTSKTPLEGSYYKPHILLPPSKTKDVKRISFTRKAREIEMVSEYLFDDKTIHPSDVGERCFIDVLKDAKNK